MNRINEFFSKFIISSKFEFLISTIFLSMPVHAVDEILSQWRGPQRNGIYNETGLLTSWPQDGPPLLFTIKNLGDGYSSPAVTNDRIYITGKISGKGILFAFDNKGDEVWRFEYDEGWTREYPGVRATPAVAGDRLYIEGAYGRITCLNTKNGKEIWSVDMVKEFGAKIPRWGHTESMLVDNDYVYCTPGGPKTTIAALNRITGKAVWKKYLKKDISGYCSPQIVHHGNAKLLVTMLGNSIIAVDPEKGKLLWEYPHPTDYGVNPNTPIYSNGKIIYFSGYGEGAVMLTLSPDGKSSQIAWKNKKFDVQIGGAVLLGNLLFGSGHNSRGWHCLDIQTGKIKYTNKSIKRGCVISAEGLLYIYTEKGTVELVKPGPQELTVISSFKITQGHREHWAHPVLSKGRLFIRHGEVMMVYNVKK